MNNSRADALLQWVNSVAESKVLHITDFAAPENVEILMNVLHLIDKEHDIRPFNGTVQDRICHISSYLEGIYSGISGYVSSKCVAEGDELELCKLISLLLWGAVQGNNVSHFVEKIHNLESKAQYHLKAIIETMLCNTEKGEVNVKLLTKLLQDPDTRVQDLHQFHTTQSPIVFSPVPQSPVETVYSNSPLLTLMLSPQMKNKQKEFIVNKLHQKVNKLQVDLDAQNHLQSTLEDELAEKNQDIDVKNTKIRQLQKELAQVKVVVDELESLQHFKNDYEKAEKEINKLKQRVEELEDFKKQNSNIEQQFENFLKEKELFEKQVEESNITKARLERYKQQAHHLEFQASELQAALHRREQEIEKIMKERDEALSAASESTELWRSRKVSQPDTEDEEFHGFEDSLIPQNAPSVNQESRLIELEFQSQRLKKQLSSSIAPEKLQEIKDRLEDAENSKKSYEEKYIEATSKILELNDSLSQLQDQSRIRQDALQRKIDDAHALLGNNRFKLEESRKEIAHLQSELSISRGEVEVHLIALEKQRVTTSKAIDDIAAERKAFEEESSHKMNELRREMESQEKRALENCQKMSKEYDSKLRSMTEELQSIHTKDREEIQAKMNEVFKEKEKLKCEFTAREEELKILLLKAENDTVGVRDVYENMLADIKQELENEIQTKKELSQKLRHTCESLEQKVNGLEEQKQCFIQDMERTNKDIQKLSQENTELNKDVQRREKIEKVLQENELELTKEIETLKAERESLKDEQKTAHEEVLVFKKSLQDLAHEKSNLEADIIDAKEKENMMIEEHAFALSSLELQHTTELESIIEKIEKSNEENVSKLRSVNDELHQKAKIDNEKITELKSENEDMKKQIEVKTNSIEQMNAEIARMKFENEQQINNYQEQLLRMNDAYEQEISKLTLQNEENLKKLDDEMVKLGNTAKEEIHALKIQSDEKVTNLQMEFKRKDELYMQRITALNSENEKKVKEMKEEMNKRDEAAKEDIAQIKFQYEETLNNLNEAIKKKEETSKKEIVHRDNVLEDLSEKYTKLQQDTIAAENRLLDITRERNELEKALTDETKQSNERIDTLSFQKEQMKAEHSKAVQEVMNSLQEERQNHKKEKKDMQDQLDKACYGLTVAADNIENFKTNIEELEQRIITEKSKAKASAAELDKVKQQSKDKQKKIFEDASKKSTVMEEAFETDRQSWKNRLDGALEENIGLRKEMFENSQKHSAEMIDLRRVAQDKEERAAIEENKLREEIRAFIANLANERVANNELKEKLQNTESKSCEMAQSLVEMEKMIYELKDQLHRSEGKEKELAQALEDKDKLFNEQSVELKSKEQSIRDEMDKLKCALEEEKNVLKVQFEEQIRAKSKTTFELQENIKEYKEKIVQLTEDYNKDKETSQGNFQKQLQQNSQKEEELRKEIVGLKKQIVELEERRVVEREENKSVVDVVQNRLQSEIVALQKKMEDINVPMKDLETSLEAMTEERDKAISELEKRKEIWKLDENRLKKEVSELQDECRILREKEQVVFRDEEEMKTTIEHIEELELENTRLEETLQEEKATNRRLWTQINSLTAQVNLADQQLREQKQILEKIQCVETKKTRKQLVIPLEKVHQLLDDDSSTDDEPSLKVEELAVGNSLSSVSSASSDLTKSSNSLNSFTRSSLRSTVGGRFAASRRQSAIYLRGKTPPEKRTTASAAYFVVGDEFAKNMEDEPDEFNWDKLGELAEEKLTDLDRLAELERRNTICKPHMKTSYPIETQTCPDKNKKLVSSISESSYRKLKRKSDESMTNEGTASKLRKDQQSSKSESCLKRSKSKKLSETVASKINALRSKPKDNVSKETEKKAGAGANVAFSIDITPPSKKIKGSKSETQTESKSLTEKSLKATKSSHSMAFTIENSPPKNKKASSEMKPKRQRTINRSTASTRLVLEKDKEVFKEAKKREYLNKSNRKPLRAANAKK